MNSFGNPVSTNPTAPCPVVFVGNGQIFSDQTIHAFDMGFPFYKGFRALTLRDLHLFASVHEAPIMIIIDQSFRGAVDEEYDSLAQLFPDAHFVMSYSEPARVLDILTKGVGNNFDQRFSFLPMNRPLDTWLATVTLLIRGERYVPSELLEMLQAGLLAPDVINDAADCVAMAAPCINSKVLTQREIEVLAMVSEGKQNKIIANDLDVSEHTVKLHVHHVLRKLGVNNRTGASAWYLANRPSLASVETRDPNV